MAWNPESKSFMDFLTWGDILRTKINVYIMIRCSWGSKCKFVQLYVPTRETSPAAKSEEKRLFSQARTIDVFLISLSVNRCRFGTESVDLENRKLAKDARQNESRKPLVAATFKPNWSSDSARKKPERYQVLVPRNLFAHRSAPSSPISSFSFSFFCFSLFAVFFALAPLSERLEQPTSQQQIRGK